MKGLSIALRIIAILGAAAAALFWFQTKGKIQTANEETAAITQQKDALVAQVEDLNNEKIALVRSATESKEELAKVNSQLNFSSTELTTAKRGLGRAEKEKEELQAKYADLNTEYSKLREEVLNTKTVEAPASNPALTREMDDKIAQLETQISQYKDEIDKLNALLKGAAAGGLPSDGSAVASSTNGPVKVAQVKEQEASILRTDNEKGIFIISRGQVDGLQQQMEFDVAKGLGRKVRVKVGTVAPTYSVAYILPGQEPSRLQEGDAIKITQ